MKNTVTLTSKPRIVIELSGLEGSKNTRAIYVIDCPHLSAPTSDFDPSIPASNLLIEYSRLSSRVAHIIGISDSQLVFLDNHSWVCSADLENLGGCYLRHFFLPYDWFTGTNSFICAITSYGSRTDVLFARSDEVSAIKGGLEYLERIDFE